MAEARGALNVLLIGLGCAIVLALTHAITRDRIQSNETRSLESAIAELAPAAAVVPTPVPDLTLATGAWPLCDGSVLLVAETMGYGGPMTLLFTLVNGGDQGPELFRVKVTSHQETPGLTDFLRQDEGWLSSLQGHSSAELYRVDAVTGATITSRAIRNHLAALLGQELTTGLFPVELPEGCTE